MAKIITFEFQLSEITLVTDKIVRFEVDPLDIDRTHAALTVYFQGAHERLRLEETYEKIKAIETKITDAIVSE